MATKLAPPGGGPPNRLRGRTKWAVSETSPMSKHLAYARGVCPSQVCRELSGERRSAVAEVEILIRAYARDSKCDPSPILARLHQVAEEEWARKTEDAWAEFQTRSDAVLSRMGRTLDAHLRARERPNPETLEAAEDELARQAARHIRLIAALPLIPRSES